MGALKYHPDTLNVSNFKNPVLRDFFRTFDNNKDFDQKALSVLCSDTTEITVIRMLAHFHQNLKNAIDQIRSGLRDGRHELIEKAAHKLVGTSELLGFRTFSIQSRLLINIVRNDA